MPDFGNPFAGLKLDRKLTTPELIRALRFAISSEYEATQLYMQLAESIDDELTIKVLKDVSDEERVHMGEFQKLLFKLAPDEEKFYQDGYDEVNKAMQELSVEEVINSKMPIKNMVMEALTDKITIPVYDEDGKFIGKKDIFTGDYNRVKQNKKMLVVDEKSYLDYNPDKDEVEMIIFKGA